MGWWPRLQPLGIVGLYSGRYSTVLFLFPLASGSSRMYSPYAVLYMLTADICRGMRCLFQGLVDRFPLRFFCFPGLPGFLLDSWACYAFLGSSFSMSFFPRSIPMAWIVDALRLSESVCALVIGGFSEPSPYDLCEWNYSHALPPRAKARAVTRAAKHEHGHFAGKKCLRAC